MNALYGRIVVRGHVELQVAKRAKRIVLVANWSPVADTTNLQRPDQLPTKPANSAGNSRYAQGDTYLAGTIWARCGCRLFSWTNSYLSMGSSPFGSQPARDPTVEPAVKCQDTSGLRYCGAQGAGSAYRAR